MDCTKEERLAEFPALLEVVEHANEDMHAYVQAHEAVFQKQSMEDVYHSVETLTKAYKKAQAMRDMCSVMCKSPMFGELEKPVQERMMELWDFSGELTDDGGKALRTLGMTIEDYVVMVHKSHENTLAARRANN